jgi:hypothetical protein
MKPVARFYVVVPVGVFLLLFFSNQRHLVIL